MLSIIFAAALAQTAPAPVPSPAPDASDGTTGRQIAALPIEQQTALRCSAAIALATERQRTGQSADAGWPDLLANDRGREFFVRSFARLMDDTGMDRDSLARLGRMEAQQLAADPDRFDAIMPACLLMLQASGL